jgi:hypothetical protein
MEIPELLRRLIAERDGAEGVAWLASLPALVDELLGRWNCVPTGRWVSGKVGLVVPARSAPYGDVVLKVSFPHPGNVHEPDAYATWHGHGAVALWERDDARFAMLLERAGPDRPVDAVTVDEAIKIAARLVRQLTVPAPSHLPRLSDEAHDCMTGLKSFDEPVQQIPHHRPPLIVSEYSIVLVVAEAALPHRPTGNFSVYTRWWVGQLNAPRDRGIGQPPVRMCRSGALHERGGLARSGGHVGGDVGLEG